MAATDTATGSCGPKITASELYNLQKGALPKRFDDPSIQKGYGTGVSRNVLYRTSNSDYGARIPNVQDMPNKYLPRSQTFSQNIAKCGGADLWRSKGLNTGYQGKFVSGCVVGNNQAMLNKNVKHGAIVAGKY